MAEAFVIGGAPTISFTIAATLVGEAHEHYEGEYTYTPTASTQTIECDDMVMDDDVTINGIPYAETSTAGTTGYTVTIGGTT